MLIGFGEALFVIAEGGSDGGEGEFLVESVICANQEGNRRDEKMMDFLGTHHRKKDKHKKETIRVLLPV